MYSLLVALHIIGGSTAIITGFVSLFTKKGRSMHNNAGIIFYYSMLLMASTAAYLAIFHEYQPTNIIVSFLTAYLVLTARKTLTNADGRISHFERLAMVYAFCVGVLGIILSKEVLQVKGDQLGAIDYFLFFYTSMAFLGAILDLTVIIRGGIYGRMRIARHVWRMTFSLWIAVGSLFLGQPQVFPALLRDSVLMRSVPFMLVTLMLLFWILRVWFVKRFKKLKPDPN